MKQNTWLYWVGGVAGVGVVSYLIWGRKSSAASAAVEPPTAGVGEYFEAPPWAGAYQDGSLGDYGSAPPCVDACANRWRFTSPTFTKCVKMCYPGISAIARECNAEAYVAGGGRVFDRNTYNACTVRKGRELVPLGFRRVLRRGMRGPDVAKWQRFIWQEGPIENGFGARTETETKWFQQQHRLVPTGIVGPETVRGAEMLNAF